MKQILSSDNLNRAYLQVVRNKGAEGVDGMKYTELKEHLVKDGEILVSERPYKRKLKHDEAVRMIVNAECGAFSMKLLQCFLAAAMQKEWVQKVESNREV